MYTIATIHQSIIIDKIRSISSSDKFGCIGRQIISFAFCVATGKLSGVAEANPL